MSYGACKLLWLLKWWPYQMTCIAMIVALLCFSLQHFPMEVLRSLLKTFSFHCIWCHLLHSSMQCLNNMYIACLLQCQSFPM